ncbi:MAG: hypothetical protein F4X44_00795 [Gammaproteobacteria bacterium]|nr:hypothetical protein [Gammaproteobacteria bacterium]MYD79141.1 hypothetical protein [Gammaproteobacteria bacterium]
MEYLLISPIGLWCQILFICFPLCWVLPIRTKPHPHYTVVEQSRKSRKYTIGLCIGTMAALLVHLCLWIAPIPTVLKLCSWLLCLPLWFLLAIPLLRVKDPGWMSSSSNQRSFRATETRLRPVPTKPYSRFFGAVALTMIVLLAVVTLFVPEPLRLLATPRALLLLGGFAALVVGFVHYQRLDLESDPSAKHTVGELKNKNPSFRNAKNTLTLLMFATVAIGLEIVAFVSLPVTNLMELYLWATPLVAISLSVLVLRAAFYRAELNRILIQEQMSKEV